jgi:hypothetical protein
MRFASLSFVVAGVALLGCVEERQPADTSNTASSSTSGSGGATATSTATTGGSGGVGGGTTCTGAVVTIRVGNNTGDDHQGVSGDSWLQLVAPNSQHGGEVEFEVDGTPATLKNGLLHFDLSAVFNANDCIESAQLGIRTRSGLDAVSVGLFLVHPVNEPWVEGDASWNQATTGTPWSVPGCAGACRDSTPLGSFTPSQQETVYTVDVTTAVEEWVRDSATNNGVLIRTASNLRAKFHSQQSNSGDAKPTLEISYREF